MQAEQFRKLITGNAPFNTETAEELKVVVEQHPFFQLAWLIYLKNLKEIDSPEFESVLKMVAVRICNRKLLYGFLNPEAKETSANIGLESPASPLYNIENKDESNTGESLIDKFLQADHGVIRQNPDELQNSSNEHLKQAAEQSVKENDEIVTETLANIYLQQKNYEKALDAFEKLSLKYPEKSVYFASRIREIEEIKNK